MTDRRHLPAVAPVARTRQDYATYTNRRAFMFTLGVVYADTRAEAEAIAMAAGMTGREAYEAHTQLGRDAGWWL